MKRPAASRSSDDIAHDPALEAEAKELRGWVSRSTLYTFRARDGTRLAARGWEVGRGEPERGAVLIIHGFGEHTARYPHVARCLVRHGFRVVGFDLRGHGHSGGRRGELNSYCQFLDDLSLVAEELNVGKNWFLYAHSLGAQLAINWLTVRRPLLQGAVLLSPWLKLAGHPSMLKMAAANLMSKIAPGFSQQTGMGIAHLSRDPAFIRSLPGGPLNHRRMSARMYTECAAGAARALSIGHEIGPPTFMAHGGDDLLCSPKATETLGQQFHGPDHVTKILPGARHELHNEIGRENFLADVAGWLTCRAA